ncbi:MAG: glycosyltransferase family 9 protein [Ktedonobacteraceae bacterium]
MDKHLLIIRPGAIGDTLLTFPLLRALKTRNTQLHITFVSNPTVLPLAQKFGLADTGFDYGASAWSELFSQAGIHSAFMQGIVQHTHRAICWLRDPDAIVRHNLYAAGVADVTVAPGRPTEGSETHVVTYLAQTLDMTLTEQERSQMFGSGPVSNAQGIAIHPGSGGAAKCWPVTHFAAVIRALWQHQIPVLLLAGPADTERFSMLMQLIMSPPTPLLLKLVVDAPLVEVAERLQHCEGYLGNDSGMTHLAAMLGLPTIVLFGPSNPIVWRPVGPDVHILHEPNLENILVESVLNRLLAVATKPNNDAVIL